MQRYTFGEVIDNLKHGQIAISLADKDQGTFVRVDKNYKFCFKFPGADYWHSDLTLTSNAAKIEKRFIIIDLDADLLFNT